MTETELVDPLLGAADSGGEFALGEVLSSQPFDQFHDAKLPRKTMLDKTVNPCFTGGIAGMLEIAALAGIVVGVNAMGLWHYVEGLGWSRLKLSDTKPILVVDNND